MSDIPNNEPLMEPVAAAEAAADSPAEETVAVAYQPYIAPDQPAPETEPPMFAEVFVSEPPRVVRIPNFGHLLLLLPLLIVGFILAVCVVLLALHFRVYGISTLDQMQTEIHYTLGAEGLGYLFTFAGCLIVFPLIWKKPYFAGLQWNGATAVRLRVKLVATALGCFLLAILNSVAFSEPKNTPIDKIIHEPGAAWMLFVFGVTFAPFFEEMFFRGFLLPALCTAYDWTAEKMYGQPRLPLGENGHPQWSFAAMATGAVLTSIPFAGMHAAQTGYSVGPFLLLVTISILLCAVRLMTRSLASSTLVHATYNFMLFSIMIIGTQGFKHMDRM
jgi:membrane protease YdiL (CAAX protease family)